MNAKEEAAKIIGKHLYLDDDEPLVDAVAAALEARDKEIAELKMQRSLSVDREWLGKLVRFQWIKWAKTQADAKPDWLIPWEQLEERYREVDRQIGEFIASQCVSPELLKVETERDELKAEIERLDARFKCGHRKVDFDDSYGECVFCKIKTMADDYDKLPHNVIACHDEIETLKAEIERLNLALLRIGERAVVDFDSETVGLVDAAVKNPKIYADVLKAEYEQVEEMRDELAEVKAYIGELKAEIARLKGVKP